MSARLDLSLVEWRALAGVCLCGRAHEGGIWADQSAIEGLTGEREDRLRAQLESLSRKGLVAVHPRELRVRVLRVTRVTANAANGGTGALDFGMDLEKGLAAVQSEECRGVQGVGLMPAVVPGYVADRGGGGAAAAAGNVVRLGTFDRSDVSTIKRNVGTGVAAAAAVRESGGVWRDRVLGFVGEADFFKFWGKAQYGWVFEDGLEALERAYRYLKAGVDSGEVSIRTTKGRALWNQFRIEQRALLRSRAMEVRK